MPLPPVDAERRSVCTLSDENPPGHAVVEVRRLLNQTGNLFPLRIIMKPVVHEWRHPEDRFEAVLPEECQDLLGGAEPIVGDAFECPLGGGRGRSELGHVEAEVVVGRGPGGIEDEAGGRDLAVVELGNRVADLAAVAPDVGRDPGPEGERGRQEGPARVGRVTREDVSELRAVDDLEGQGRGGVRRRVAVGRRGTHVEGALSRRDEVEPVAAAADEPRHGLVAEVVAILVGRVELVTSVVERAGLDDAARLFDRVEPLAEPVKVFPGVGGRGDRRMVGGDPVPVDDLVA